MRGSLQAYKKVNISSQAEASPHRVVQLLLGGSIEKLLHAKLAMEQNDIGKKGELIGRTMEIITHLQAALDLDKGGEIADNLAAMYDYMMRRLVEANGTNDAEMLLEVVELLQTIKSGWDEIPAEYQTLQAS